MELCKRAVDLNYFSVFGSDRNPKHALSSGTKASDYKINGPQNVRQGIYRQTNPSPIPKHRRLDIFRWHHRVYEAALRVILFQDRRLFISLAGLPTTVAPSGTSRITTAPAPIVHPRPILIPGMTTAPAPIQLPAPTLT